MKFTRTITIDKPIADVWKVLAEDFASASEWMAQVPSSHASDSEPVLDGAPVEGRVCQLSDKPNGLYAEETITTYDEKNYILGNEVIPRNGKIPVEQNVNLIKLISKGPSTTFVEWNCDTTLKTAGKILKPVLKAGFKKSFDEILEELKYFVENGTPHPRKLKKMKAAA